MMRVFTRLPAIFIACLVFGCNMPQDPRGTYDRVRGGIATRLAIKEPSRRFPCGYHRVVSIAFLCASLALFTMGILLLSDALVKLVQAERPTIGGVTLFGKTIWLGWLMIPALLWSAIPAVLLGRQAAPGRGDARQGAACRC